MVSILSNAFSADVREHERRAQEEWHGPMARVRATHVPHPDTPDCLVCMAVAAFDARSQDAQRLNERYDDARLLLEECWGAMFCHAREAEAPMLAAVSAFLDGYYNTSEDKS